MEWIRETTKGVLLPVRAVPRASKNEIQGIYNDAVKIRLTTPPVDGKANAALIKFLSKTLGVPRAHITLSNGDTGRNKIFLITGIARDALIEKMGIKA